MKPTLPEHLLARESEFAANVLAVVRAVDDTDDDLAMDTIEGETGLFEAIEMALSEIRECDATSAGAAAIIEQFSKRKRRAEARKNNLRAAIEQAMLMIDQDKIKLPCATLSLAKRKGSVVIDDEARIPSVYWELVPKLDKSKLAGALVSGAEVPGAHLSNGTVSLSVRVA